MSNLLSYLTDHTLNGAVAVGRAHKRREGSLLAAYVQGLGAELTQQSDAYTSVCELLYPRSGAAAAAEGGVRTSIGAVGDSAVHGQSHDEQQDKTSQRRRRSRKRILVDAQLYRNLVSQSETLVTAFSSTLNAASEVFERGQAAGEFTVVADTLQRIAESLADVTRCIAAVRDGVRELALCADVVMPASLVDTAAGVAAEASAAESGQLTTDSAAEQSEAGLSNSAKSTVSRVGETKPSLLRAYIDARPASPQAKVQFEHFRSCSPFSSAYSFCKHR